MFHPFQVEQYLSENEQGVSFNYSESGVHPLTLCELMELSNTELGALAGLSLDYPQVEGDQILRERISRLYVDTGSANVLVTVGASEANYLVAQTLLEPGDEIVALRPTYQQLPGNALNVGVVVRTVDLVEENNWALDLDQLTDAVGPRTKLIAIVNPNNPTGHVFTAEEMQAVVSAAERSGAWIVADEVYAGTERENAKTTPSFIGTCERVIGVNSMSKAYGLPGLRLGWVVAPTQVVQEFWRRHEYVTISASVIGMELAKLALDPAVRPLLIARARRLIRTGFETLAEGLSFHHGVFSLVPPQASAMSFIRYNLPVNSRDFADRLARDKDMLVLPGDCFGLDNHFRFSSALPNDYLNEGLSRLNALVEEILMRSPKAGVSDHQ